MNCAMVAATIASIGERTIKGFSPGEESNQRGVRQQEVRMLNKYSLALACVLTALPQMVLAEDDAPPAAASMSRCPGK